MEMTIAISKADYNSSSLMRIGMTAIRLGFSLQDSGEKNIIRYFGVNSVSKISKLARRINEVKRAQSIF